MPAKSTIEDFNIFNNLLEGVQIISREWKYIFVNNAVLEHAKKSWEELLGRTMMEVYPGIETTPMFSALEEVMETRVPARMQNEFTYPDGSQGTFELSIQPWPDGILILSMDITASKK
jgi:nitrogen-specific signal transduction histidine kinase